MENEIKKFFTEKVKQGMEFYDIVAEFWNKNKSRGLTYLEIEKAFNKAEKSYFLTN